MRPYSFRPKPIQLNYDPTGGPMGPTAWWINTVIGMNIGFILWAILTIATLFQQFDLLEPLTVGFFWISVICLFAGFVVTQPMNCSWTRVKLSFAIQLLGVMVQVMLVIFYWENLVAIDDALRAVRSALMGILGLDHRFPLRVIWILCTFLFFQGAWYRGSVFIRVGKRPW